MPCLFFLVLFSLPGPAPLSLALLFLFLSFFLSFFLLSLSCVHLARANTGDMPDFWGRFVITSKRQAAMIFAVLRHTWITVENPGLTQATYLTPGD